MKSEHRKRQNREAQWRYRKRHAEAIKLCANLGLRMDQAREMMKRERNRKDKPCATSVSCTPSPDPQ
jgi:hypothetical protein